MSPALESTRNLLKAWLVLAVGCGILALAGWSLGGYRVLWVFVFCGLLLGGAIYFNAERIVVGLVGAQELPVGKAPTLHASVESFSARIAIVKPKLYLLPHGPPRALTAGRGPSGSALAVSSSLLTAATPAELEGILAHELAHVRNRDVLVQTIAVVIAALLVETSRIGGWLQRALLFVLGPIAAACVHLLLSPKREFAADRVAAGLCGSPHGLADGLIRLEQTSELIEFAGSPATEPLYTINPFAEDGIAGLFGTHPPIGERVSRLRELDPSWRDRLRAA